MLLDGRSTTAGQPFKGHGSQGWTRRQGATERGQAAWGAGSREHQPLPGFLPVLQALSASQHATAVCQSNSPVPTGRTACPRASRICPDAARPPQISITGSMFGVEPSAEVIVKHCPMVQGCHNGYGSRRPALSLDRDLGTQECREGDRAHMGRTRSRCGTPGVYSSIRNNVCSWLSYIQARGVESWGRFVGRRARRPRNISQGDY